MGRAFSVDLREQVLAAVDGGMSCQAAAARFGVGASSAIRWRQQQLTQGHLKSERPGGNVRFSAIEVHSAFLLALVEERPDLKLVEIRDALAGLDVHVSVATVWRFFKRHHVTRKGSRPKRPSRTGPTS